MCVCVPGTYIFSFGTLVLSLYNNRCHFIKIIIVVGLDGSCVALFRWILHFCFAFAARASAISDNATMAMPYSLIEIYTYISLAAAAASAPAWE